MSKITQKQLIESLKQLKEIKPRAEWAVLLKSQIVAEKETAPVQARSVGLKNIISNFKFQISNSFSRRLAYSLAVILFLIVGVFGFAKYTVPGDLLFPIKKIAEQGQAALTGQPDSLASLNNSISDLSQLAKAGRKNNIPSAINEVNANVSELVKNLKANPTSNQQEIKAIASSLKTLADVPGTDLTTSPDVKNLYQTVVQNQIADLKKTTLTDDQQKTLATAEDLYGQGKYTEALEAILMINN